MLDILHHEQNMMVVNKPAGMPSQPDKTEDQSALKIVEDNFGPHHIIGRLDRPVSGCLTLIKQSPNQKVPIPNLKKKYLAVVPITNTIKDGTTTHYLSHDRKNHKSLVTDQPTQGFKEAILHCQLVEKFDNYQLVEVELLTGRFHQIRAQLAHLGLPIKGDVKYGARRRNRDRSIDLHAFFLGIDDKTLVKYAPHNRNDSLWKTIDSIYQ